MKTDMVEDAILSGSSFSGLKCLFIPIVKRYLEDICLAWSWPEKK